MIVNFACHPNCQIETLPGNVHGPVTKSHFQFKLRIWSLKFEQQRRYESLAKVLGQANSQKPFGFGVLFSDSLLRVVQENDNVDTTPVILQTGIGDLQLSGGAVKESGTKLLLQACYCPGHDGRRQPDSLCSTRNGASFNNRTKDLHSGQFIHSTGSKSSNQK
jgi:hypothetical protein